MSVVTVVRNAVATIGETLASVAAQTDADLEHIVVDGCSTDGTCRLVRAAPHRPRLLSEPDHGIYDGFNKGLTLARGRWITFLNADDVYAHPRVVATVLEHAARAPNAGLLHADMEIVDTTGRPLRALRFDPAVPWTFDLENPIAHPTAFVARWVYARLGGFDATYEVAGDYDLLLRMHLAGVELRHVPEVFVRMRVGGRSDVERGLSRRELMRAWYRCTGRPPWRRLLRDLKVEVLDRWTPNLSIALGAAKRVLTGGPRASMQRQLQVDQRDAPSSSANRPS